MVIQLLEFLIISAFNWVRHGCFLKRRRPPLPTPSPPANHVVLGQVIPAANQTADSAGEPHLVTLSPENRRRHLYLTGGTGSGKTNAIMNLIASDLAAQHSIVVFDLRGDLCDKILLRLAEAETPETLRERLVWIDLRDTEHVVGFNALQGTGDAYNRALHLTQIIRAHSENWGVQLDETLRCSLIALTQAGDSLLAVERLLSDTTFRAQVLERVSDPYTQSFFVRYSSLSAEQQSQWRLPVLNKLAPFISIPQLRLMLGSQPTFSFRMLDEVPGAVILVSLAVDRLHTAAYLAGGLFASAFQAAIMARVDQPESTRRLVYFFLDEFENFATPQFETLVAEGRRYGLSFTLSHQHLHQLSPSLCHTLRNNVNTQLYLATGALDAAELAQEVIAEESKEEIRTTLMTLGVGEAILNRRGQQSLRIRIPLCPAPVVDPEQVRAIKQASLKRFARPRLEVEQELQDRESSLHLSQDKPTITHKPATSHRPKIQTKPIIEVRHAKDTQFKPEDNPP